MSRRSERLLGELFRHDMGSSLQVALTSLEPEEEIDILEVNDLDVNGKDVDDLSEIREGDMQDLENPSELAAFEEFIGVANAASERLEADYNLRNIEEEIQYLKDFDETRITRLENEREGPREYVEKISELADNISNYVESTGEESGKETVSIDEIFETFENYGQVDYNDLEQSEVLGDEGLCVVANTIAENAMDHGSNGEKPDLYAEVTEDEETYTIDIWDDGKGLSEEFGQEEIFKRNNGSNSGLGLYLSREITELFDGSLEYSPENSSREGGFGLEWVLKKPEEYM